MAAEAGVQSVAQLRVGRVRVDWLFDNRFHLDGGAMFGVVPKVLWSKRYPSDPDNFIPLVACPLLVRAPGATVLIESGLGDKLDERRRRNFGVRFPSRLDASLAALGLSREDVDLVVLTHLDWDHAGGCTLRDPDGRVRPAFPRARYVVQRAELEDAMRPNRRSQHAYWPENWQPVAESGQWWPVDGEVQLTEGVTVVPTGGHTRGHQAVLLGSGGETALHLGDLLPTHAHLNPLWVMAYDNFPLESVERKERWLARARGEGWWLTFYHDPFLLAGRWDEGDEPRTRIDPDPGWSGEPAGS